MAAGNGTLRGSVGDRPWGPLLASLGKARKTVQITVRSDDKMYLVALDRGLVVAAASPVPADTVARIGVAHQLLTAAHANEIKRGLATSPKADEVDVAAAAAKLDAEAKKTLRIRVLTQRAARTFAVEHGEYEIEERMPVTSAGAVGVDIRAVVFAGARMLLSADRLLAYMRELPPRFVIVPSAVGELDRYGFSAEAQPVVDAVEAPTTLAELEALHRQVDPRCIQAVVYALASGDALAEVEAPAAPPRAEKGKTNPPTTGRVATVPVTERVRPSQSTAPDRDERSRDRSPAPTGLTPPVRPTRSSASPPAAPRSVPSSSSSPPPRDARSTREPSRDPRRDDDPRDTPAARDNRASLAGVRETRSTREPPRDARRDDDPREGLRPSGTREPPRDARRDDDPRNGLRSRDTREPSRDARREVDPRDGLRPSDTRDARRDEASRDTLGTREPPRDARSTQQPPRDARSTQQPPRDARSTQQPPRDARSTREPAKDIELEVDLAPSLEIELPDRRDSRSTREPPRDSRITREPPRDPRSTQQPSRDPRSAPQPPRPRKESSEISFDSLSLGQGTPQMLDIERPSSRLPAHVQENEVQALSLALESFELDGPSDAVVPQNLGRHEVLTLIKDRSALIARGADHFALLGLSFGADIALVQAAYAEVSRHLRPERLAELGIRDEAFIAQSLLAQLGIAFTILTDGVRRQEYMSSLRKR